MLFCPLRELWSQPIPFIGQVLDLHLNSMLCEDIVTEVKGLRLLDSPFPDLDSSSTLRDLLLAARTDPDVPDSHYLFTSIEQSGLQTRFLFYEERGTAARDFVETLDESIKRHFDIEDTSILYLPNYGPTQASSQLNADFTSLQHLFPTSTPHSGLLTQSSANEPSSYMQSLLMSHAADSPSTNQHRRSESQTLTRRGRRL
jgi:hypothetical protein